METTEPLLPCPFCAGEAEILPIEWGFIARCTVCTAQVRVRSNHRESIVAHWNMRKPHYEN